MSQEPPRLRLVRATLWLRRRLPRLLMEALLLLALLLALEWWLTRDAVRGPAPDIQAVTLAGHPFSLAQLRGEPALVYFWATWCPVCRLEQGTVAAVSEAWPTVTVAMQSGGEAEVRDFLAQEGLRFRVINDPMGTIAARYGVLGVPAAFVLDPAGQVRFVTRGYTTGLGLHLRLWVAGWL